MEHKANKKQLQMNTCASNACHTKHDMQLLYTENALEQQQLQQRKLTL
jgi:hypothetical protein